VIILDAAPGVHAVVHGHTNCFVVEADDGVTLVDAGYRGTWAYVEECLSAIKRSVADVRGLLITHGHFDHLGFAALVRRRWGIPVWAHPADLPICRHPYSYQPERPRLLYPLAYPRALPVLAAMVAAGALAVPGTEPDRSLVPDQVVPVPGDPLVIHTPGHTDGSCVFYLADRRTLITGDTLVTLDPYTGRRGPRIVARAATHDGAQAFRSVDKLRALAVDHVLPGHGDLWHDGIDAAVEAARVAFLSGS
jgi:glyoxylase-like metal-dependent hydrolase (beta-lactamase superfamily II)